MSDYKVDSIPAGLPVGTILYWAGTDTNNLPSDWKVCDNQMLRKSNYTELFQRIGTTYGYYGTLYFRVPDLTGCRVRGASSFGLPHGATSGGSSSVTLTNNNLPSHTHGGTNWYHNHTTNDNYKFHDAGGGGYLRYVTKGNSSQTDDSNHKMIWHENDYSTVGGSSSSVGSYHSGNTSNQGSGSSISLNPSFINLYAIIKVL